MYTYINNMSKLTKLADDDYVKPKITSQQKLTAADIQELLKYYESVDDVYGVKFGSHLRYFSPDKNDEMAFRLGGTIINKNKTDGYINLGNGKKSWSVQVKSAQFYKQMTLEELDMKKSLEKEQADKALIIAHGIIKKLKLEIQTLKKDKQMQIISSAEFV